ncbi:FG-GAP-like repeat-containing protein, partial [Streptomyces sp. NPDC090994]|uniref:FG-GAP-like repeat-containing protein n=1 Tax=Streptomyces sp. NPDC090994 TaxID=3365969 RepID=UPI00380579CB
VAVFYDGGTATDGKAVSSLYTFTSDGTEFQAPQKVWTSTGSFDWNRSQLASGDYNGDGKHDVAVYYDKETTADGRKVDALFSFLSTGTGFQLPSARWQGSVI